MLLKKLNIILSKIFVFLIQIYRKVISPLTPDNCIYYPTCSNYSIQALQKYGFVKGIIMAAWRVIRCNPWNKGGYDPLK